ncbi:hypothetical protein L208DRAFT_1424061 [Tricholoma matsutake]|nr:hypothetical protein L208DRAFT_1424061 [Tricholoma matsutake 945]
MCFTLPILLDEKETSLVISPLMALMVDQVSTVAVCSETLAKHGVDKTYEDIAKFHSCLRAVCIDEAHCISLWGGSFHPDYADLGVLHGHFPSHIPFIIASATLPAHVLDDICAKLQLGKDAIHISVTNSRPNVALSCHELQHSEESTVDLRFLIPIGATKIEHVPITLDICDNLCRWTGDESLPDPQSWIAFYHAKIGCDMWNIHRVILWGLPPSFCALVQHAGCAVCDLTVLGEAILIVPGSMIKKGLSELEVESVVNTLEAEHEAENRSDEAIEELRAQGIDVNKGNEQVLIEEGGIRVSNDSEGEEVDLASEKKSRWKKSTKEYNSQEARYSSLFVSGQQCRRKVWDEFFGNANKRMVKLEKMPELTHRRKKELPKELTDHITLYPRTTIMSPVTLLGDDVVDSLVKSGVRIQSKEEFCLHTRWFMAFEESTGNLTSVGEGHLKKLGEIYAEYKQHK